MPIDRRITNGLAWAGAILVIAIPAADAALRQFGPQSTPQVALVEAPIPAQPTLPTTVSERPATPAKPAASAEAVAEPSVASAQTSPVIAPDVIETASVEANAGDAVDQFLQSGRPLPSYISGADSQAAVPAAPEQSRPVANAPVSPPVPQSGTDATSGAETVASVSRPAIVGFPTPVSQRPAPVPVATQAPLIIETEAPVITAGDLEDWESGPLSEFLAQRQREQGAAPSGYDADGFFLDEGPNQRNRPQRFPRAYDSGFYPLN